MYAPPPRLNLVVLRVADLDAAERFYAALGLAFTRHRHGSGPEHLAYEAHGIVLELYPAAEASGEASGESRGARVGFGVAGVYSAVAAAVEAGGTIVSAPKASPWGLRAVLADLDGHSVELVEPHKEDRQAIHSPADLDA